MATVCYAEFSGVCPLCQRAFPKDGRIVRTPAGWSHEVCAAEWKHRLAQRTLAASGVNHRAV